MDRRVETPPATLPGRSRASTVAARRSTWAAYLVALVVGSAWTWATIPAWALLGRMPLGRPFDPDYAQHVIGQRYFWHEPWHLHDPLVARTLDVPFGTMIGLTDSLPLVSVLLKPFVPLLPAEFQAVTPWLAMCWVLQTVAAVFALRAAGERRLVPAAAIAACAAAMPTFLSRLGQSALSAHFLLLLAIGLAFRLPACAPARRGWPLAAAMALGPVAFLIHPYLAAMTLVTVASAPATLAARRAWRPALRAGAAVAASAAAVGGLAWWLGYTGGARASGFGVFSMNLLSPVRPDHSALLSGNPWKFQDATGGQYEGYQYLGAGLLLGICALPLLPGRRGAILRGLARHPGLVAACILLTVFALSDRVYAGHALLLLYAEPPGAAIFRCSGRFFWPVAYALLVGTIAAAARAPRRWAWPLLGAVAVLQTIDAGALRRGDRGLLAVISPLPFDPASLQLAMARARLLTIDPPWPCEATRAGVAGLMDVLTVAGRVMVPVDTMYTARQDHPLQCDAAAAALARPLRPGELRVLYGSAIARLAAIPDHAELCRRNGEVVACALAPGTKGR